MSRRELPEPTMFERADAAKAARALRAVVDGTMTLTGKSVMHVRMSRPRRGEWITTWENVPGFRCLNGAYQHDCLPGWSYTKAEIKSEMIPDLEALAERGVRPTEVTA